MSVKVTAEKAGEEKIKYPCLMESKHDNTIILANESEHDEWLTGVVLVSGGSSSAAVGEYIDNWVKHCFVPYEGKVILEAKK